MIRGQRNSQVRRILKPLAFDKQFDEAIDRFRQHRQNVEDEARTCHMIEAAEQRDAQLVLFAEERRRNLLARLSKVNSKHRHRKLKDSRHDKPQNNRRSCAATAFVSICPISDH
jgi:hypothetical protein